MRKVLLIAHFCGNFDKEDNSRFVYIASLLAKEGVDVEIVTSSFSHLSKKEKELNTTNWPFKITLINEPGYNHSIGFKRLYSHYIWGRNLKKYLKTCGKPDIVYSSIPSLSGAYEASKYCRQNGIKFIVDVQDLWPEAFQMVLNVPLIFKPLTFIENKIFKQADEIFAVSDSYVDRALSVNKKCTEGTCIYLGTNIEKFNKNASDNPVLNKPEGKLWLGYCGTLGHSYDLKCVMDAMVILKDKGIKLPHFIVMGDGPKKKEFENYAIKHELPVTFTGWLSYEKMCGFLCACDIVVNPIIKGSKASIINKHADYAASRLPVVNTQECKEYRDMVSKYEMGINCNCGDPMDVAQALTKLITNMDLRHKMGENSLICAKECFDRRYIYGPLLDSLKGKSL